MWEIFFKILWPIQKTRTLQLSGNRLITLHCQNYANNDYFSMEESYHIYLSCFKACLRLKKKKKVIVPYSLVKIWGTTLWNLACMVFLDRSKSSAIPDVCLISMPWTNRPRLLQMCWRCYETGPNICMHIISNEQTTNTYTKCTVWDLTNFCF